MAILSKKTWSKHANPWSGWSRLVSYPLLFAAIWYRNWIALVAVIIWFIVNPFIFPKPKSTDSWMSRSILGEQIWTKKYHRDFPQLLNVFNGIFFVIALYASYRNMLWHVVYPVILSLIFKMWFLDRMVFIYEANKDSVAM